MGITVKMQGAEIVKVDTFKYLRSTIRSNGHQMDEDGSAGSVEWVEMSVRDERGNFQE